MISCLSTPASSMSIRRSSYRVRRLVRSLSCIWLIARVSSVEKNASGLADASI